MRKVEDLDFLLQNALPLNRYLIAIRIDDPSSAVIFSASSVTFNFDRLFLTERKSSQRMCSYILFNCILAILSSDDDHLYQKFGF